MRKKMRNATDVESVVSFRHSAASQAAPKEEPSGGALTSTRFELHHGDCLEGMRLYPDGCVDVVVTSPPYNLDIVYSTYRDSAQRVDFLDWCCQWGAQLKRLLSETGSFFLNIGSSPASPMLPHEIVSAFRPLFVLQNTIHWIKSISVATKDGNQISAGHFKPIQSERFLTDCHEFIFHFTKTGAVKLDRLAVGVPYSDKSNIARWGHTGGRDLRCRGNNWFIPYKTIKSRAAERPHPATFPVSLASQCLKLHGLRPGMVMLDPFLGIGNSALAARECGVERFIGFEIDESYLQECKCRLQASPAPTSAEAILPGF